MYVSVNIMGQTAAKATEIACMRQILTSRCEGEWVLMFSLVKHFRKHLRQFIFGLH